MMQRFNVKEGQRYAQCKGTRQHTSVWKVGAILATDPSIPHVRLINVADPLHTKTISCFALRDSLYYELVAETATGMG